MYRLTLITYKEKSCGCLSSSRSALQAFVKSFEEEIQLKDSQKKTLKLGSGMFFYL